MIKRQRVIIKGAPAGGNTAEASSLYPKIVLQKIIFRHHIPFHTTLQSPQLIPTGVVRCTETGCYPCLFYTSPAARQTLQRLSDQGTTLCAAWPPQTELDFGLSNRWAYSRKSAPVPLEYLPGWPRSLAGGSPAPPPAGRQYTLRSSRGASHNSGLVPYF